MSDHCTRELTTQSTICALHPKGKITKCLSRAGDHFARCSTGVSAGESHSQNTYNDHHGIAQHCAQYEAPNGDTYNNGKLVAFVADNGIKYRVRRIGPR
jgi:hypothetical protein